MPDTLHLRHYCTLHEQRMCLGMQRHTHITYNNLIPISVPALLHYNYVWNRLTYVAYTNKGMDLGIKLLPEMWVCLCIPRHHYIAVHEVCSNGTSAKCLCIPRHHYIAVHEVCSNGTSAKCQAYQYKAYFLCSLISYVHKFNCNIRVARVYLSIKPATSIPCAVQVLSCMHIKNYMQCTFN